MANPMPGFIIDVQEIKAGLVSAKASSPSDSSRQKNRRTTLPVTFSAGEFF